MPMAVMPVRFAARLARPAGMDRSRQQDRRGHDACGNFCAAAIEAV